MPPASQTRKILVKIDTQGSRDLKLITDQLGGLNRNTKSLAGNMSLLTNAFRGWLGFVGVREITQISDSMQNLENRLKIVTVDGKSASAVLEEIGNIANRTYQPIQQVGDSYARIASAMKGVGANTEQLSVLTETLINTFRIAGTTTTETTNTMIQLSQAFSSSEVRGQELRSVLEQNSVLAGILKDKFKGDLFKAAADGAIRASTITRLLAQNLEQLNAQASLLTPTFEQTANVAKNEVYLAVHELNKELDLSVKFFKAVTWTIDNFKEILSGAAIALSGFAAIKLAPMIASLTALDISLKSILLTNPVGWAIAAGGAFAYMATEVGGLENLLISFNVAWNDLFIGIYKAEAAISKFLGASKHEIALKNAANELEKYNDTLLEIANNNLLESETKSGTRALEEQKKLLLELAAAQEAADKRATKQSKLKDILAELNKEFLSGRIDLQEYNQALVKFELGKINREFAEGKTNVIQFHQALRDMEIEKFNRYLAEGSINLQQFNALVSGEKVSSLTEKFEAGKISLQEYNAELIKLEDRFRPGASFQAGVQSYITSVGTISEGIAKGIEQAFGHLETNFLEFIKTGKFNFDSFTQAVLDDLTKIIIRASIIRPIADGILGLSIGGGGGAGTAGVGSGGGVGSDLQAFAKGGAFNQMGNVVPFAKGGIVDSPTGFSFGGGRRGVMGEAGPEAILPLARGANGNLGVQASVTPVQINIINQSGAGVEQTETTGPNGERIIEVLISNKVKEGIARGDFDRQMKTSYGLTRKGS